MLKIKGLNFWLASTLEIRFTTPAPVKKSKNAGNYSRLAFKFYCVSMTQLLHMNATLGNHSNWNTKLAVIRCGRHKFCYLYSHHGNLIIGILISFESKSV
jgi:hypothetical protein